MNRLFFLGLSQALQALAHFGAGADAQLEEGIAQMNRRWPSNATMAAHWE